MELKKPKITCQSDPNDLRIYFNGLLHFCYCKKGHCSMQSWKVTDTEYWIEFVNEKGNTLLAYNTFYKWSEILKLINQNI